MRFLCRQNTAVHFLAVFLLVALGTGQASAQDYIPGSLPTLPSFSNAVAYGINASGQIVGEGGGSAGHGALYWSSPTADPPIPLASGGYSGTAAYAISDAGQIVGGGFSINGVDPLFWADRTAAPTLLQRGGFNDVVPRGINAAGVIVGHGGSATGVVAVVWQGPTAAPAPLSTGGFQSTEARGINDAGQIVGWGSTSEGQVALFWESRTSDPIVLPSFGTFFMRAFGINDAGEILGGSIIWANPAAEPTLIAGALTGNEAYGINDLGQLVGQIQGFQGPAFWANQFGGPIALPTGFAFTDALGINDAGQIVGGGASPSTGRVGLFWPSSMSVPIVLPRGDFSSTHARDINNAGQIVGDGISDATGQIALFWASPAATPVPLLDGGLTFENEAHGINDAGQIVGEARGLPLYWASPGASPTVLSDGGLGRTQVRGINDAGEIVGWASFIPGFRSDEGLFWSSPAGAPSLLPKGSMDIGTEAFGINDRGQIVGVGASRSFGSTAIVWASRIDPPAALPQGTGGQARGINNAGVIVGPGPTVWRPLVPLFLHAKGASLFLDANAPTDATADVRDSPSLKFAGGNVWKAIGTWSNAATAAQRTLVALRNLRVYVGLKNSKDQGTLFDLRAEVSRGGVVIASRELYCVTGVTRNPADVVEVLFPFHGVEFGPTQALSLKIWARIGTDGAGALCGGHAKSVGLHLYFDAVSRPAQLEVGVE